MQELEFLTWSQFVIPSEFLVYSNEFKPRFTYIARELRSGVLNVMAMLCAILSAA